MSATPYRSAHRLKIAAPSYEAARRLSEQLASCHCLLLQDGKDSWTVSAQPLGEGGGPLVEALTAVERWLDETGVRTTQVTVGDRRFTMAAWR